MKKTIIIIWLIFLAIHILADSPSIPSYRFPAPDFNKLLPFTKTQLSTFKEKNVRMVERKWDNFQTYYYFNHQGLLLQQEYGKKRKRKDRINYVIEYKYNDAGQLVEENAIGDVEGFFRVLSYDSLGRITRYLCYSIEPDGRKTYKHVWYDMKLYTSNENEVILKDSTSQEEIITYKLSNENEVILVYSSYGKDSVSYEYQNDSVYTKKYWFKDIKDSTYRIGEINVYKDGLLMSSTSYAIDRANYITDQTNYYYNTEHQLLRTEKQNKYDQRIVYTYNYAGLIMDEIEIWRYNIYRKTYKYYYHKQKDIYQSDFEKLDKRVE